jgi:hypothetical protein
MVNILRTPQVRLAQKSIPTGLVYQQNEEVLESVGAGALQEMLEARDWEALSGEKVDRKKARVDYYSTARALQGLRDKDEDTADVAADVAQPAVAATAVTTASSTTASSGAGMQSEASVKQHSSAELSGAAVQYDSVAYSSDEQAGDAAVSSAEDMKAITTALMMRLMRRKPLEASAFETFSAAVDRMLAANER